VIIGDGEAELPEVLCDGEAELVLLVRTSP
jgi:hypothetical protein